MPLPLLQNLDDRRWADLVDEGVALIPPYAPDWTDHNISDPGRTLIDLFAWIAEMDIYQLNRVPDQHRRKFLALVGIVPEPPHPARTVLSFTLKEDKDSLELPVGAEFEGEDPFGRVTRFRTVEPITIVRSQLVAGELKVVLVKDDKGFHDRTDDWTRGKSFDAFGTETKPGAELYLGFSGLLPKGKPVSLFFTFEGLRSGDDERRRLLEETGARRTACRPPLSDFSCQQEIPPPSVEEEPETIPRHHGVRIVWEVLTAAGAETVWQQLGPDQVDDETRALTLDGRVRVYLSVEMAKPSQNRGLNPSLYYLRVRFEAGSYDAPPLLRNVAANAVAAEQAVPVGTLQMIGGKDVEAVLLDASNGAPNQEFTLPEAPVQESSFQLFTLEKNEWRIWRMRADFDASTRSDPDFLLDSSSGKVTFGNAEKGRVPRKDVPIYAVYRATRAEAGNLAADTVTKLADNPHNRAVLGNFDDVKSQLTGITNPIPTTAGAAAETLAHAEGRAVELLDRPNRAVTVADYESFAMETPGVRLARVSARANVHPAFPCYKAPGMIALIVLPYLPADRPMPSRGLLRAVTAYLTRRRVIGTRVQVVGPTYLKLAVKAKVQACTGVNKPGLMQQIIVALNRFFHALEGGPGGTGWPFGRDVYRSEVLQVIDEAEGVDHVLSLELIANGGEPQCGNVCLGPTGLVAAGQHQIQVV